MTARESLTHQMRRWLILMVVGAAIFVGSGIMGSQKEPPDVPNVGMGVGAGVLLLGLLAHHFWVQCPRCRGALGRVAAQFSPFQFPKRLRFCPYCSLDLDSPLDGVIPGSTAKNR